MYLRKLAAGIAAIVLTFGLATSAFATSPTGHQVTICHGTNSETNPYVQETVDISSSGLDEGQLKGGHNGHIGPVWYPGAKAAKVVWGDIIPPYDYVNGSFSFHFDGLNWDAAGQAIYKTGCVIAPAIHIVKTPSVTNLAAGGGPVTYTYAVTNTGNVPVTNVTVTDNKCAPVTFVDGDANSNSKLDLSETWTFTCTITITATRTNTATATGHAGSTTVKDTDQATVTVATVSEGTNPDIHVVKSAPVTTLPAAGGEVTYTYKVTNTGDVALTGVTLTDNKCTTVSAPSGDANSNGKLDLTETWTFTCTTTVDATTTNTATATGHDGDTTVTDTDDWTVTVQPGGGVGGDAPAIHIVKTPSVTTLPVGGGPVTYTYKVTNIGDVQLTAISVTDNKCAPVTYVIGDTNSDGTLDLTETWTYTCTMTLTHTTTNTALATGHDGDTAFTDTDHATVTVTAPGGGVLGETSNPTPPSTDTIDQGTTTSAGGSLPFLLIILGVIGFGAALLTPVRPRR
jgi:uncharacterized repeat protein (TIGR01451 family)